MLVWRFTTHHSPLIPHMQYFLSKEAMRWPDKVTALHSLTHRIVFANAPHCVFSFITHRSLLTAHRSSLTTHYSPLITSPKSQCGAWIKSPHCIRSRTALSLSPHRIVFAHAPHCVFSFTAHCSSLTTHHSNPHNNVPSAACPAASTLICVVRALLYKVMVAFPSLSSIRLGFQYSVRR